MKMKQLYFKGKKVLTKQLGTGAYGYFGFSWKDVVALCTYFIGQIGVVLFMLIGLMIWLAATRQENMLETIGQMATSPLVLFGPFLFIGIALLLIFWKELKIDMFDFWKRKWKISGISMVIWLIGILMTIGYSYVIESIIGVNQNQSQNQEILNGIMKQGYIVFIIFSILIVPFIEEIIFRKVLFTHFGNSANYILSGIVSTFIFAGIHLTSELFMGQWIPLLIGFPTYFIAAVSFTLANYVSKNFFGGYIAHVLQNTLAVVGMLMLALN